MRSILKSSIISQTVLFPFIEVTSLFALWGFANAFSISRGMIPILYYESSQKLFLKYK
ncbi:hypothetical protein [Formosa sediminum]|uniref:hypothetical protein n=1 Tax=Formosa sediminum TaxID=2594004 RepID=UPI00163D67D2|nr:hypothetical protein [Formosa sediminum]